MAVYRPPVPGVQPVPKLSWLCFCFVRPNLVSTQLSTSLVVSTSFIFALESPCVQGGVRQCNMQGRNTLQAAKCVPHLKRCCFFLHLICAIRPAPERSIYHTVQRPELDRRSSK